MRILYLHPNAWSGEYAMLAKLRSLGHDVFALEERRNLSQGARHIADFYRTPDDGIRTLWYDPRRGGEKCITWPIDRLFKSGFDGRNLAHRMWIIHTADRLFKPDVLLASDGFSYAIPAAFLRRAGLVKTRLVASYIGGDILDCPQYGVGKARTPMVRWLIRSSLPGIDVARPLCDSLARVLVREGADMAQIAVLPIHLVAPMETLDRIFARRWAISSEIRRAYGIAPDAPLIVTLSGNHRGKGLQDLASAWADILSAYPDCRWLLCGHKDPWLEKGVWPILKAAGVEHTVHPVGELKGESVFEHLAAADLHVNPTLCEGLNMVTVEAAAVGTPTITSDGAGIADWVESLNAGAVVPAGEVTALRDAIIAAVRDNGLRLTWQTHCRMMAAEFSLDRISAKLLDLLGPKSPS